MTRSHPTLRLGRIKGFASDVDVPLAPITLVFGWNSAGKSTILQSLLLLKQTVEEADPLRPSLVVNGSLTQLGSFRNLVHRHDTDETVRLGVDLGDGEWMSGPSVRGLAASVGVHLDFRQRGAESVVAGGQWTLRYPDGVCHVPFTVGTSGAGVDERRTRPHVSITSDKTTRRGLIAFLLWLRDRGTDDPSWRQFRHQIDRLFMRPDGHMEDFAQVSDTEIGRVVAEMHLTAVPTGSRMGPPEGLMFAPDFIDRTRTKSSSPSTDSPAEELIGQYVRQVLTMAMARADAAVRRVTSRVVYLGPFRQPPERLVLLTGEQFADVGAAGENTIALLARSSNLRHEVDAWLERLDIPYKLAVDPLETTREMLGDVLVAGLRERGTGTAVGMRDVGFGVSQILPVIVQAIARQRTLLAVEQPELHVHPRLQAKLGDLFVEQARHGSRFLLETHSEHLILRLLTLVRGGRLAPEDLAVLYVDRDTEHNSVAHHLRVDEFGEFLDRWPHGFFTERRYELGL